MKDFFIYIIALIISGTSCYGMRITPAALPLSSDPQPFLITPPKEVLPEISPLSSLLQRPPLSNEVQEKLYQAAEGIVSAHVLKETFHQGYSDDPSSYPVRLFTVSLFIVNFKISIQKLMRTFPPPLDYKEFTRSINGIIDKYNRMTSSSVKFLDFYFMARLIANSVKKDIFEFSPFTFRNYSFLTSLVKDIAHFLDENITQRFQELQNAQSYHDEEYIKKEDHGNMVSSVIGTEKGCNINYYSPEGVAPRTLIIPYFIPPDKFEMPHKKPLSSARVMTIAVDKEIRHLLEIIKIIPDLTTELIKNDRILVIAAGNESIYLKKNPLVNYHLTYLGSVPSLKDHLIYVGALEENGTTIAGFSNLARDYSDKFIFSPGEKMPTRGYNDEIRLPIGTSFAAPFVGGVLVLLGKYFPELSMTQIRKAVLDSAAFFSDPALPRSPGNLFPEVYGRGKIAPYKAFLLCNQIVKEMYLTNPQVLNSQLQRLLTSLKKQELTPSQEQQLRQALTVLNALQADKEIGKYFPFYEEAITAMKTKEGKQHYLKKYLEAGLSEEKALQEVIISLKSKARISLINQIYDLLQSSQETTVLNAIP